MLKYSVTDDPDQEELVSKVCEALRAIARGNNQVIDSTFCGAYIIGTISCQTCNCNRLRKSCLLDLMTCSMPNWE